MKAAFPERSGSQYDGLIRFIIRSTIENRRKYEAQLKYKKEKEQLLDKDSNAVIPRGNEDARRVLSRRGCA